jgi:hypothetical protein
VWDDQLAAFLIVFDPPVNLDSPTPRLIYTVHRSMSFYITSWHPAIHSIQTVYSTHQHCGSYTLSRYVLRDPKKSVRDHIIKSAAHLVTAAMALSTSRSTGLLSPSGGEFL